MSEQTPDKNSVGYGVWEYFVSDWIRESLEWPDDLGAENCIFLPRAIAILATQRFGARRPTDDELQLFRPIVLKALRTGDLVTQFWFEGRLHPLAAANWRRIHLQALAFDGHLMEAEFQGSPPLLFDLQGRSGYVFVTRPSFEAYRKKRGTRSEDTKKLFDLLGEDNLQPLDGAVTADRWEALILHVLDVVETQGSPPKSEEAVDFLVEMGTDRKLARKAVTLLSGDLLNRRGRPRKGTAK